MPGKLDCDGYFTAWDGNVVMVRDEDRPVTVEEIESALSDLRRLTEGGIVGGSTGG